LVGDDGAVNLVEQGKAARYIISVFRPVCVNDMQLW
jgi:hypothetical protein